jgi:hypothetical protein
MIPTLRGITLKMIYPPPTFKIYSNEVIVMANEKTRNAQRKNGDKTPQARRKAPDVERKIKEKAEEERK